MKQFLAEVWAYPLYRVANDDLLEIVNYETARWATCLGWHDVARMSPRSRFARIAVQLPEFRSLYLHRLRKQSRFREFLMKSIYRGEKTLHIHCDDIAPGLFIQHGFATTITARSVGRDAWINQQVTIGHSSKGSPRLGDRVRVGAAAVIIGPISIGNDVTIGVNSTIVHDVPAGTTMVAPLAQTLPSTRQA